MGSLLLDQRGITGEKKTALGRMGKWGQGLGSSGSSGCPVCLRSVFPMEAVMAADRTPYHKYCLKCNECGRKLEIANMNEHEKLLFCGSCYQVLFRAHSDILVNDSRKMQVLPVSGNYDKKETLKLEAESEYRRREEAVLATKRVMAERARADAEARQREGIQTYVKIAETVAISETGRDSGHLRNLGV